MVFVANFCSVRPEHEVDQKVILEWLAGVHEYVGEDVRSKLFRIGLGEDKIQKRGVSFGDVFLDDWDKMTIYNLNASHHGYGFTQRTQFYERFVTKLFETFYPETTPLPDHLIHVTCTGYIAPSGAQKMISSRGAPTIVTHAYHMGCYAAMPALRMAKGFASPKSSVDIVHTELCSLHLNPNEHTLEQLVIQTLFADGFIKYTLSHRGEGLELLSLHEEIIPDSQECMVWKCHDWGLSMKLSKEVPRKIAQVITPFLERLSAPLQLSLQEVIAKSFFAVHPGGVKIIEAVSEWLQLQPWQTEHSRAVMQQYGNMSSATQPHIWEKMHQDPKVPCGALIISFAFGPGLTISGGVFKKCTY